LPKALSCHHGWKWSLVIVEVKPAFSASTTNSSNWCIEYCSWAAQYPMEEAIIILTQELWHAYDNNVCNDGSIYLADID
jgi:hypothetical protein